MRTGIFVNLLLSFIVYFATGSLSSIVFFFIFLVIGVSIIIIFDNKHIEHPLGVFLNVYAVYTILALLHYGETTHFGQYIPDEIGSFIPVAKHLMVLNSIPDIFLQSIGGSLSLKDPGYYFFIGVISYLSNHFWDGYSDMTLYLGSVVFGAGTTTILYKLLSTYVIIGKAKRYAYFFAFLSLFNLYSVVILRDVHIAFFFALAFLILLRPFSTKGIIVLSISTIIVYFLRASYGLLYTVFVLYYLAAGFKKLRFLYIVALVFVFFSLRLFIQDSYEFVSYSIGSYSESTIEKADQVSGSLGAKLLHLPTPIKEISQVFYSQIAPFPSWGRLERAENFYDVIGGILQIFNSFFWSVIFFCLLAFCFRVKLGNIPRSLIILTLISLLVILINTANMSERRIMCVYPLLFTLFVFLSNNIVKDKAVVRNTIRKSSFLYVGLCAIYFILKF